METNKEHSSAFLTHISAYAGYFIPLGGVIVPLIFWQIKKDESTFLDQHGKEAVNFNLSFMLYTFILSLAIVPFVFGSLFNILSYVDNTHRDMFFDFQNMFGLFGSISLIGFIALIRFILILLAAIKANQGEHYAYPLTIKFIK